MLQTLAIEKNIRLVKIISWGDDIDVASILIYLLTLRWEHFRVSKVSGLMVGNVAIEVKCGWVPSSILYPLHGKAQGDYVHIYYLSYLVGCLSNLNEITWRWYLFRSLFLLFCFQLQDFWLRGSRKNNTLGYLLRRQAVYYCNLVDAVYLEMC